MWYNSKLDEHSQLLGGVMKRIQKGKCLCHCSVCSSFIKEDDKKVVKISIKRSPDSEYEEFRLCGTSCYDLWLERFAKEGRCIALNARKASESASSSP